MACALDDRGDSLVLQGRGRQGVCGVTTIVTTGGVVAGQIRDILSVGRRLERTTREEHEVRRSLIIRLWGGLLRLLWCQRAR